MRQTFSGRLLLVYGLVCGLVSVGVGQSALASDPIATDPAARWWKGNLHTHTFWSDGNDFPEMVCEWYRDNGWNFLALSDHNVLSRGERWMSRKEIDKRSREKAFEKYIRRYGSGWVETRNAPDGSSEVRLKPIEEYRTLVEERGVFLMIEAEEVTGSAQNGRDIHINVSNVSEKIEPASEADVPAMIARTFKAAQEQARKNGKQIVVHVNHPNYKWGVTAEDLAKVIDERFVEVFNGVDSDNDMGNEVRASSEQIWDIATSLRLASGQVPMYGLATDDSHDYHNDVIRAMPGRGWVMVKSTHLTPNFIAGALNRGDFYSSSGVELERLEFDATSKKLIVKIKPVAGETYTIKFIGTRRSANLVGKPRMHEGKLVETTLDYSDPSKPSIGEVFQQVQGTVGEYVMKGDEMFVRATIESSGTPAFPTKESQKKMAWTQPMGWEKGVK